MKENPPALRLLQLLNGDQIIAQVTGYSPTVVNVRRPAQVLMGPPQGPGQPPSVGLAPWPMLAEQSDDDIEIERTYVMVDVKPLKKLEDEYQKVTSPILQTPKSRLII